MSFLISILLGVVTLALAFWILVLKENHKQRPPGPWGLPVIGHLLQFGQHPPTTFARWQKKYGNVFSIRMGSWNTVVLNGYDVIKKASDMGKDVFSSRPAFLSQRALKARNQGVHSIAFGPFSDEYMFHRKSVVSALRTVVSPTEGYVESLLQQQTKHLTEQILENANTSVSIIRLIKVSTMTFAYRLIYGGEGPAKEDIRALFTSADEFVESFGNGNPFEIMPWLAYIFPGKLEQFRVSFQVYEDIRLRHVAEHLKTYDESNIRDVTDALLVHDLQNEGSNRQIESFSVVKSSLSDLLAGGYETTYKTIAWLILLLTKYPDIQHRVQTEIDEEIPSGCAVAWKDRTKVPFTYATVYEAMRFCSVLPFSVPRSTTKDVKFNGYDIDANTVVIFNVYSIMHDKAYWGDPEIFRPDRFMDNEGKLNADKVGRVLSFGIGRRRCPGENIAYMNVFLTFTSLMRNCRFVKADGEAYSLTPNPGLIYNCSPYKVVVKGRE